MQDNPGKKRVDVWREQYHMRRYLQCMSETDLAQRLKDVVNNSIVLTEKGQAAPRLPTEGGGYWMMKLTHIQEEYLLREQYFPDDVLKGITLPKFTYPQIPKAVSAIKNSNLNLVNGKYLVKYGRFCYLEKMFKEGAMRIAPASSYKDSSLNYAIHDDEMVLTTYGLPQEVTMTVKDSKTGEDKGRLSPKGNITYYSECKTDYYVFCLSLVYDYRLFDDFDNSDCCIVIHQLDDFLRRVESSSCQELPGWRMFRMPVIYLDPFNTQEEHTPFFTKNFKYAYQFEYRLAWIPPNSNFKDKIDYLFLNIGDMKDIAKLIVL